MLLWRFCVHFQGRKVYEEFILNLTRTLGAKNDSYNDILDIIDFEIKLAQVCAIVPYYHVLHLFQFQQSLESTVIHSISFTLVRSCQPVDKLMTMKICTGN